MGQRNGRDHRPPPSRGAPAARRHPVIALDAGSRRFSPTPRPRMRPLGSGTLPLVVHDALVAVDWCRRRDAPEYFLDPDTAGIADQILGPATAAEAGSTISWQEIELLCEVTARLRTAAVAAIATSACRRSTPRLGTARHLTALVAELTMGTIQAVRSHRTNCRAAFADISCSVRKRFATAPGRRRGASCSPRPPSA